MENKNDQIRAILTNNTEAYKKRAFVYLLHIEDSDFYKFGETRTTFAKRKANIIQEWKQEGVEVKIEPLIIHPVKSKVHAIFLESKIRKKLSEMGFKMYGNDHFETTIPAEEIINIVSAML
jgi:hypothetical protein